MRRLVRSHFEFEVLQRDSFSCQMCGFSGDARHSQGLTVFRLDYTGDGCSPGKWKTLCVSCASGREELGIVPPTLIQVLGMVRRATVDDQLAVLAWLGNKYSNMCLKPKSPPP